MTIVPFIDNYAAAAAAISRESFPDPWTENGFLSYINEDNSVSFAALDGNKLAGYIMASSDGDASWIDSIAVQDEYRRKGIAFALIDSLAEKSGGLPITIEVRESNSPARGLYKKFGFQTAGIRRDMYSSPRENAVVMIFKGSEL